MTEDESKAIDLEMEHEYAKAMAWLDRKDVPRQLGETGPTLSLVGRLNIYADWQTRERDRATPMPDLHTAFPH